MTTCAYITAALCAAAALVFIWKSYTGGAITKLLTKAAASLLFLLTAVLAALTPTAGANTPGYTTLMLLGLVFGFVGDVLLESQAVFPKKQRLLFVAGLASFLLGHVFYIIVFARLAPVGWLHFAVAAIVFALVMALKAAFKVDPGKMLIPVMAYVAVISLMVGFAVGAYVAAPGQLTMLVLVGALLFLVSDALLAYIYFGPKKVKPLRACNLSFYYAAQILLALTILIS